MTTTTRILADNDSLTCVLSHFFTDHQCFVLSLLLLLLLQESA